MKRPNTAPTWVRRVGTATGLLLVIGVVSAPPATAASCSGSTTWTGSGDGHSWTDATNWDAGVPTASNVASIVGAATVDAVDGTVCGLAVNASATSPGVRLTSPAGAGLVLTGDSTLAGLVTYAGLLSSQQSLALALGTDLTLASGSVVTLDGSGALGAQSLVHAASGVAVAPILRVSGSLGISGSAHLAGAGLELVNRQSGAGLLDLLGSTLTVDGPATSSLGSATAVTSTQPGGVLVLGTGAALVAATGAAVQLPATLRVAGGTFGGGGAPVTFAGNGTFSWQSGSVEGNVTFGLPTVLDGGGIRVVPATSTLTNANQLSQVDGTLDLQGTLVNGGTVQLRPGSTVRGTAGQPSTLTNLPGATVAVEPVAGGGSAVLDGVHLSNAGIVSIPPRQKLIVGSSGAAATSDLLDGGTLSAPTAPAQTTDSQGILQITQGATVRVSGTTMLDKATLLLDDPAGDGSSAQLVAGSSVARLNAATPGGGGFTWRSGAVLGAVTVDNLTTEISSVSELSHRRVFGLDDTHPGQLTLGGTASLNPAVVELGPNASLVVTGTLTLASSPGGIDAVGGLSGQALVIATGGTLRHVAQSTTANGSSNSTGAMSIGVPVVNNGTVSLETSLNVPAGYTQDVAANAAATAADPVTGVFGGAILSASNGSTAVAPITLVRGGLGGSGTVQANPLTTGTGFLHPGTSAASGTMTLQGPVQLGSGTDLQIVLRSATDHDKLVVAPLTVGDTTYPGTIALAGRLSGLSSGYSPPYGTVVPSVVSAATRTGTFGSGSSSGVANGLGWRPSYPTGGAVDLKVVDVAPPAIGIAGNPAFTQLPSQRFTYSAVDNKAGVDTFDVRWRQASTVTEFGPWNYPASWQHTKLTSQTLGSLIAGRTYCFSVRASDKAHNTTDWSQPLCTAKLLDDRQLSASPGWTRPGGKSGYYNGTYSESKTLGATLRVSGTFTRVAVTAKKCRGCGNLLIYSGSTRIGSLVLNASTTGLTSWVSPVLTSRRAVITLRVSSGGHPVAIDGVGLAR